MAYPFNKNWNHGRILRNALFGALLFVSVVAAGFLFFADYTSAEGGKFCIRGECFDSLQSLPVNENFGFSLKYFQPASICETEKNIYGPYCNSAENYNEGLGATTSDPGSLRYSKGYCQQNYRWPNFGKNCATEYEARVQNTSGLCIKGRCFNIDEPSVDFRVNDKKHNFQIQSGEKVTVSVRTKNVRDLLLVGRDQSNERTLKEESSDSFSVGNVEKSFNQYQTVTYTVIAKGGPYNREVANIPSVTVAVIGPKGSESRILALARGLDKGVEKYTNNVGARLACGTIGFVAGAYFGGEAGLTAGAIVGSIAEFGFGTIAGSIAGGVAGLLAAGFSLTSFADSMCSLMTGVAESINSVNAVQGAWDWNKEMKEAGIFGANAVKGYTLGMILGALRGMVSTIIGEFGKCIGDTLFSLGLLVFDYILSKADIDQQTKNFVRDSFWPQEHNYAFDFALLAGSTTMESITRFVGDKGLSAAPFGLGEIYKGGRDLISSIGNLPQCPSVSKITPVKPADELDCSDVGRRTPMPLECPPLGVEPTGYSEKPDPLLGKHRTGEVNVGTGKATNLDNPGIYFSDNVIRQANNASQVAINVARWNNYLLTVGSDQIMEAIRGLPSTVLEDLSKIYEKYNGDMSHAKADDLESILQTLNEWGVLNTIPIKK